MSPTATQLSMLPDGIDPRSPVRSWRPEMAGCGRKPLDLDLGSGGGAVFVTRGRGSGRRGRGGRRDNWNSRRRNSLPRATAPRNRCYATTTGEDRSRIRANPARSSASEVPGSTSSRPTLPARCPRTAPEPPSPASTTCPRCAPSHSVEQPCPWPFFIPQPPAPLRPPPPAQGSAAVAAPRGRTA